jgi:hypothetical protein
MRAEAKPPEIHLPPGWQKRPVTDAHRKHGLIGAFINPTTQARLFVWADESGSSPKDQADIFIAVTERLGGVVRRAEATPPDAAVVYLDRLSGRGGYIVFRIHPNRQIISFDADFPPEHAKETVAAINGIAKSAFSNQKPRM